MSSIPGTPAFSRGLEHLKHATGIVIPIYLPDDAHRAQTSALIHDTVIACREQVSDPSRICLSVDGAENGGAVARQLAPMA